MKRKFGKKTAISGIAVLVLLVVMLGCLVISAGAATTRTAYCEHCKATVAWEPMQFNHLTIPEGATTVHKHYYLTEDRAFDAAINDAITISPRATMCLDLNGYTWECNNRAFTINSTVTTSSGAANGVGGTLNLMDSVGGGQIIGHSDADLSGNESGGVFYVRAGSTLNIYGGTYKLNGSVIEYSIIETISGFKECYREEHSNYRIVDIAKNYITFEYWATFYHK